MGSDEDIVKTSLLHSSEPKNAALLPQVLAVLVVSLSGFVTGTTVVFGIYAIMGLARDSSNITDTANLTETGGLGFEFDIVRDSSWPISLPSIGMILGSVLAAPLSDRLGRRMACV